MNLSDLYQRFLQSFEELWNGNPLAKVMVGGIVLGLFILLATFLPVILGVIALAVVGIAIYRVTRK